MHDAKPPRLLGLQESARVRILWCIWCVACAGPGGEKNRKLNGIRCSRCTALQLAQRSKFLRRCMAPSACHCEAASGCSACRQFLWPGTCLQSTATTGLNPVPITTCPPVNGIADLVFTATCACSSFLSCASCMNSQVWSQSRCTRAHKLPWVLLY